MAAPAARSKLFALSAAGVLVVLGSNAASAPSQSARSAAEKTLTVMIANEGGLDGAPPWGHVSSSPPGIDCPPTCGASFAVGTAVKLSSAPAPGYSLAGWNALPNDPACEQEPTCSLTIDDSQLAPSVQATFHPAADLQAVTAGPGTLLISPVQPGANAVCEVDAQQENPEGSTCIQRFTTGTPVTLTARPNPGGARFVGWSDYACATASRSCTLTLAAGERYITARFSPVTLTVQGDAFGAVVVRPRPGGTCTFKGGLPCDYTYPSGTLVTLRRQHGAAGKFWIGGCNGNSGGRLDAARCQFRLQGNELVGAGLGDVEEIPPPRGSGIEVTRDGLGRGKVTGRVINGTDTLDCGTVCSISGLTRYDQVSLTAIVTRGRFDTWSDGYRSSSRVVQLSRVNRIKATFARR